MKVGQKVEMPTKERIKKREALKIFLIFEFIKSVNPEAEIIDQRGKNVIDLNAWGAGRAKAAGIGAIKSQLKRNLFLFFWESK